MTYTLERMIVVNSSGSRLYVQEIPHEVGDHTEVYFVFKIFGIEFYRMIIKPMDFYDTDTKCFTNLRKWFNSFFLGVGLAVVEGKLYETGITTFSRLMFHSSNPSEKRIEIVLGEEGDDERNVIPIFVNEETREVVEAIFDEIVTTMERLYKAYPDYREEGESDNDDDMKIED